MLRVATAWSVGAERMARLGLLACVACVACNERANAGPVARPSPAAAPSTVEQAAMPAVVRAPSPALVTALPPSVPEQLRVAGTSLAQDEVVENLRQAPPVALRPVGVTQTVFRVDLGGERYAAFKTETVERPFGPFAEIAAYRLARCLGLDEVPPATYRSLPVDLLRQRLEPAFAASFEAIAAQLAVGKDGRVRGAMIYWVPELTDIGIDRKEGLDRAARWLALPAKPGALPESDRGLASSISVMLGFDYLIGNFDRWSGGNTKGDPSRARIWIRDHDLAFPGRLRDTLHRRIASQMTVAERQSRAFVQRVRELDRACLERELREEPEVARMLSERQIEGVFERRSGLLSHIDALIEEHGEAEVLSLE